MPVVLIALLALLLASCSPPPPVKLGYVSTLSGRSADLGISGRNGALLAIEEINANGGIHGRPVQLVVRDDALSPEVAASAIEDLAAQKVDAIVGPMLSHMAFAMAPVATRLQVVLVSPTATADELLGRDDFLFRLSSPTSAHARLDANFQFRHEGRRRIAVAYETTNRTYAEGYLKEFRKTFSDAGGELVMDVAFDSGSHPDFAGIIRKLGSSRPDALLFIANAVDTVTLAQHSRRQMPDMPLAGVAWAGTEELLELGGKAIEGMHFGQYFNRDDQTPSYLSFKATYQKRFQELPGFGSTAAYDATRTVLEALQRKRPGQPLNEALLSLGPFRGVQQPIAFDRFGDALRPSTISVVRNHQFVTVNDAP